MYQPLEPSIRVVDNVAVVGTRGQLLKFGYVVLACCGLVPLSLRQVAALCSVAVTAIAAWVLTGVAAAAVFSAIERRQSGQPVTPPNPTWRPAERPPPLCGVATHTCELGGVIVKQTP